MITSTSADLALMRQYIQTISGIFLDASKDYLIQTRLSGLLSEASCLTYQALSQKAKADVTGSLRRKIIDAITTQETFFFRDQAPFELLKFKLLPDLIDRRRRSTQTNSALPIRIWSAACSTGQEIYSIAIVIKEVFGKHTHLPVRLLGTDLSDKAISQASRGIYTKNEMERGLPLSATNWFEASPTQGWKIRDELRAMATFRTLNLMENFGALGKFDIIFCRNVAIYFSETDRKALFDRLAAALDPEGALLIGSTETLLGISSRFEPKQHHRTMYYQLKTHHP